MKKTLLQVLGLCVSPNVKYSSKCFAEIYRAQYENAMLVYLCGAPIWRPENSVNICYLLSLMSRNARDDKNGRFGEGAPQLTMLAKLAILAIFCQFRQIS